MEYGQKNQIEEVNTYEENEQLELTEYKNSNKTCLNCEFAYLVSGKVECHRREAEGVIVEIGEDQLYLPCPARDAEVWDEEMDSEGNFRVDDELGYGYQLWLNNRENKTLNMEDYIND